MVSSRAWFILAVAGVLGLFYVGVGVRGVTSDGMVFGQPVQVRPIFKKPAEPPQLSFDHVGAICYSYSDDPSQIGRGRGPTS